MVSPIFSQDLPCDDCPVKTCARRRRSSGADLKVASLGSCIYHIVFVHRLIVIEMAQRMFINMFFGSMQPVLSGATAPSLSVFHSVAECGKKEICLSGSSLLLRRTCPNNLALRVINLSSLTATQSFAGDRTEEEDSAGAEAGSTGFGCGVSGFGVDSLTRV